MVVLLTLSFTLIVFRFLRLIKKEGNIINLLGIISIIIILTFSSIYIVGFLSELNNNNIR